MTQRFTRRALLATALSSVAGAAFANAPLTSIRPEARLGARGDDPEAGLDSMAEIIADANLGGTVGCVVGDLKTGQILEVNEPFVGLPPASVAKAVTALFAFDALGPEFVFETELRRTGPIENGVLQGDLILVGGGDPNLVTDQLATLVDGLVDSGITKITGAFFVWDQALPYREEIDPPQLDHLGYNPSVSGLNLNFNRVHFEWRRANGKYTVAMDARSPNVKPDVYTSRM
ncbi:MAG: D-alanyl-D-alanine carboxypeptidase, partial [Pseudomonadota bacterium]